MLFEVDERIRNTCIEVSQWGLSTLYLKNEANYPWFILVPRIQGVTSIEELTPPQRYQLMDEITRVSCCVKSRFNPDKINVASLGNVVSQLHIHVVGRYHTDSLWPQGVWQAANETKPYLEEGLAELLPTLSEFL